MKILIVTEQVGKSAAGNVTHALINAISDANPDCILLCNNCWTHVKCRVIEVNKTKTISQRLRKLLLIITGVEFSFFSFQISAFKIGKDALRTFEADFILSIINGSYQPGLSVAYKISREEGIPLVIHSLDPLPSPPHWGEKEIFRQALIRSIQSAYQGAALVASTNKFMLEYQLSLLNIKSKPNLVLYNPLLYKTDIKSKPHNTCTFLYLGSFYGKRKPDSIIKAFIKLLATQPQSILSIVGENSINLADFGNELQLKRNIKLIKWTDRPQELILDHAVLIDVDAPLDNDVFISSKFNTYLSFARVILGISQMNSPTRVLAAGIKESIVFSNHEENNIYNAMLKAIHMAEILNISQIVEERQNLIQELQDSTQANKLLEALKLLKAGNNT